VSAPLVIGCLWVVAAALVAMLPIRRQYAPGLALLIAAPLLIVWIGAAHGWGFAAAGLAAFVSMFRRPLGALWQVARGRPVGRPPEPEEGRRCPCR
jgi:hypothetical protein